MLHDKMLHDKELKGKTSIYYDANTCNLTASPLSSMQNCLQ